MPYAYQGWAPHTATAHAVFKAGFSYDPQQDIIYSKMDAWQYQVGFTWSYDVASPHLRMILDCEPFYFTYGGKKWMIELWKGQYGLETGAEIGVYTCVDTGVSGVERQTMYGCASKQEYHWLKLKFVLKRTNGGPPLTLHRGPEHHWWLTGFKWGEFTERTSDLTMDVAIEFQHDEMRRQFVNAATKLGYYPATTGRTVTFQFIKPKTPQPASRAGREQQMQSGNKVLVDKYRVLKRQLGLSSNDPNGFDFRQAVEVARPVAVQTVRKVVEPVVRKGFEKVQKAAEKVADRGRQIVPDHHKEKAVLQDIFAAFHNKVWKTSHRV
jgi:hypothetical protein